MQDWELDDEEERHVRISENMEPKTRVIDALVAIIRRRAPRRQVPRSAGELFDIIMRTSDIRVSPEGHDALKELVQRLEEHDAQSNLD